MSSEFETVKDVGLGFGDKALFYARFGDDGSARIGIFHADDESKHVVVTRDGFVADGARVQTHDVGRRLGIWVFGLSFVERRTVTISGEEKQPLFSARVDEGPWVVKVRGDVEVTRQRVMTKDEIEAVQRAN